MKKNDLSYIFDCYPVRGEEHRWAPVWVPRVGGGCHCLFTDELSTGEALPCKLHVLDALCQGRAECCSALCFIPWENWSGTSVCILLLQMKHWKPRVTVAHLGSSAHRVDPAWPDLGDCAVWAPDSLCAASRVGRAAASTTLTWSPAVGVEC